MRAFSVSHSSLSTCSRPGWAGYVRALLACLVVIWLLQSDTALFAQQIPVRVAAAADLEPLLPGLLDAYQKQSGQRVEASFASSATLATQIENGAPFDIFLSADMMLPQRIVHDGFAAPGATAQPYARGTLVLWARNQSGLKLLNLEMLGSSEVRSIAIANPQHAPYGRAAMQALKNLGLLPAVEAKLRTAENIAQTAQFASTGNADVGLISLTSALTMTAQGHYVAVPQTAYETILQGAVALKGGANEKGAAAFLEYLHSPAVAERLQQGGLAAVR